MALELFVSGLQAAWQFCRLSGGPLRKNDRNRLQGFSRALLVTLEISAGKSRAPAASMTNYLRLRQPPRRHHELRKNRFILWPGFPWVIISGIQL